MLKRLFALIGKDIQLVIRNWFVVITLFMAVLFILLVNFVVPEDVNLEPYVFILDQSENNELADMRSGLTEKKNISLTENQADLEDKLRNTTGSFAMILSGTSKNPNVEFLMQGYESEKIKALIALDMKDYLGQLGGTDESIPVSVIGVKNKGEIVPFNHSVLPLFLLMEPVLLGLFFIATLMFFEKAEGTTRAFSVSPGRLFEFLFSKVIVMFVLGLFSMYLVTFMTVGWGANLGLMLIIATAGSLFGSSLGLFISSFFDNLSKAMIWIIFASLLLSVPFASYYLPNFSPVWVRIMPTYSLLFALKETIYQTGQLNIVWQSVTISGVLGVLLFGASLYKYRKSFV